VSDKYKIYFTREEEEETLSYLDSYPKRSIWKNNDVEDAKELEKKWEFAENDSETLVNSSEFLCSSESKSKDDVEVMENPEVPSLKDIIKEEDCYDEGNKDHFDEEHQKRADLLLEEHRNNAESIKKNKKKNVEKYNGRLLQNLVTDSSDQATVGKVHIGDMSLRVSDVRLSQLNSTKSEVEKMKSSKHKEENSSMQRSDERVNLERKINENLEKLKENIEKVVSLFQKVIKICLSSKNKQNDDCKVWLIAWLKKIINID
jgi:hypothetical protein